MKSLTAVALTISRGLLATALGVGLLASDVQAADPDLMPRPTAPLVVNLIAIICHRVSLEAPAEIKDCGEFHVMSSIENPSLTFIGCLIIGQQFIAGWKAQTKYADESYTVEGWKCADNQYVLKGRV